VGASFQNDRESKPFTLTGVLSASRMNQHLPHQLAVTLLEAFGQRRISAYQRCTLLSIASRWESKLFRAVDLDKIADGYCGDLLVTASQFAGERSLLSLIAKRPNGAGAEAQEGVGAMSKKHMGSSVDDFLKEEDIFEETQAQAVKEVVAWQLAEAMKKKKISKNKMAALLKTSRTQVDRLLNAKNDITLSSLQRAAAMVGRRVTIELV
jgi:hypothetical protein